MDDNEDGIDEFEPTKSSKSATVCDECFPPGTRRKDNEMKGWRWKCAMCKDYDLCTSCVMHTKHDCRHVFVSAIPPGGQEVPSYLCGMPSLQCAARPGAAHDDVSCRACEEQVVGLRFSCAICENYNLCENCFRSGQPQDIRKLGNHNDQVHAWFLIRAPIKKPAIESRFGSLWPYVAAMERQRSRSPQTTTKGPPKKSQIQASRSKMVEAKCKKK